MSATTTRWIASALLVCSLLATSCGADGWPPQDSQLVFADEFDGNQLDADSWNTCHWWSTDGGCTIASNDELQWYQPDNVVVANGVLRLEARIESTTATDGTPYGFTSGMVSTGPTSSDGEAKFAFTYGAAAARVRIPAGAEFWPAFWLLPASTISRPEIDIMEMHGDQPKVNGIHLHGLDSDGDRVSFDDDFPTPDVTEGWHEFGVIWAPDSITWLLDGKPMRTLQRDNEQGDDKVRVELPAEPLYVILNLAVDSEPASAPTGPAAFPAVFEIDWVRVWQHSGDS